jgi:large subunit ribosomal protein L30
MKKKTQIKITQIKSHINRPQGQKDTVKALGLGKINKSRIMENSASVQGMIDKVAHLLSVENIKG